MEISEIQPELFQQFSRIVQQKRLSHAYLFAGGFGSFELAVWLGQACFCDSPSADGLPCLTCRSCRLVADFDFSDFHLVEPEGQTIKANQIRELGEVFSQSSVEGGKKMVLIRQADKMNATAANSLLKSMEEAAEDTHIILLSDNENLILPTIRSRAQLIKFPKNLTYMQAVFEQAGLLKSQATLLSQISRSIDEGLELSGNAWYQEGVKKLSHWVELALSRPDDAYLYLANLLESFDDKNKQKIALEIILNLFHEKRAVDKIEKAFHAIKIWQFNVNFESALSSMIL